MKPETNIGNLTSNMNDDLTQSIHKIIDDIFEKLMSVTIQDLNEKKEESESVVTLSTINQRLFLIENRLRNLRNSISI